MARERYLKHWWKRHTTIDPGRESGTYFGVIYDAFGRVKSVAEYIAGNRQSVTVYAWRLWWLRSTETYDKENRLQYTQRYRYGPLGNLLRVEKYGPDEELISVADTDL